MQEIYTRTEAVLGADNVQSLRGKCVMVFGVGGVGSFAVEGLARAGVGKLALVDPDVVAESNINRQIQAFPDTVGIIKAEALAARVRRINPLTEVAVLPVFATEENLPGLIMPCDYIVDALDTVATKIALAAYATSHGIPFISSMGMANKLHPEQITINGLYSTKVCPLARVMRAECKKRGIPDFPVVFSPEPPVPPQAAMEDGRPVLGSVSFVPSVAGLVIAGRVVRNLCCMD